MLKPLPDSSKRTQRRLAVIDSEKTCELLQRSEVNRAARRTVDAAELGRSSGVEAGTRARWNNNSGVKGKKGWAQTSAVPALLSPFGPDCGFSDELGRDSQGRADRKWCGVSSWASVCSRVRPPSLPSDLWINKQGY